jgi:hypothetical protein
VLVLTGKPVVWPVEQAFLREAADEPQLEVLAELARQTRARTRRWRAVCAHDLWHRSPVRFPVQLYRLVGPGRDVPPHPDPQVEARLRSESAYSAVFNYLYFLLGPCRGECSC